MNKFIKTLKNVRVIYLYVNRVEKLQNLKFLYILFLCLLLVVNQHATLKSWAHKLKYEFVFYILRWVSDPVLIWFLEYISDILHILNLSYIKYSKMCSYIYSYSQVSIIQIFFTSLKIFFTLNIIFVVVNRK